MGYRLGGREWTSTDTADPHFQKALFVRVRVNCEFAEVRSAKCKKVDRTDKMCSVQTYAPGNSVEAAMLTGVFVPTTAAVLIAVDQ